MKPIVTYTQYRTVADRHVVRPHALMSKAGAKRFLHDLTGQEDLPITFEPGDYITVARCDGNELLLSRHELGGNLYYFNWLNPW